MRWLKRADAALAKVESFILVASLLGVLLLGVVQIVLRLIANSGLDWGEEVSRNITVWIGFLGASLATWEGKHLNVDALTRFLSRRLQEIIAIVIDIAAAGVCVFLCHSSIKVIIDSLARFSKGDPAVVAGSGLPVAVWQMIFPIAFAIITFRFLIKAAEAAWELRTGGDVTEIESEGAPPKEGGE